MKEHKDKPSVQPMPQGDAPAFRIQVKNADMSEEMQERALELAKGALQQQLGARDMAGSIKKEFDRVYGPAWHCIVGKAFGSFVTHGTHVAVY